MTIQETPPTSIIDEIRNQIRGAGPQNLFNKICREIRGSTQILEDAGEGKILEVGQGLPEASNQNQAAFQGLVAIFDQQGFPNAAATARSVLDAIGMQLHGREI